MIILSRKHSSIDKLDAKILRILQNDCRTSMKKIAKQLGVPKSTIHNRIKRLEADRIIEGYHAKLDATKLGKDFITITNVRAKYGPSYHKNVGKKLAQIPGLWGVYLVFGEIDFVVLAKSDNREDFMKKLEKIMDIPEIERSNTEIVASVIKEDPGIELASNGKKHRVKPLNT